MVGLVAGCGDEATVVRTTDGEGDGVAGETGTAVEVGPESGTEVVASEVAPESESEVVASEFESEPEPESESESESESEPEIESESESEIESESESESEIESETESEFEPEPETALETESEIAPEIDDTGPEPLPALIVNEVDCRGTPADWVEVVNVGATPIVLAALALTDDLARPDHRLPLATDAADALLAGERRTIAITAFGINCGAEAVTLLRDDEVIDSAPPTANPTLTTWGRLPDTTGAWQPTQPTPGAINGPVIPIPPPDPGAMLFDPARPVPTIDVTLSELATDALRAAPYEYVPATFAMSEPNASPGSPDLAPTLSGPLQIGTRIKGRIGSFAPIDAKPALKISFSHFAPDQTFRGVSRFDLNNFQQDGTRIHELLAYRIFRAMGVPAPRTGYAWVRINGTDRGLYLVVEAREGTWLDRNLPDNVAIFEGAYGQDLEPGMGYVLERDRGPESARLTLESLIDTIAATPDGSGFMAALAPQIDWDEVLAAMATEVFIGHWDGYAPTRNNYFLAVDTAGVWRLLPWGTDQTFGSNDGWYDGQGLLLRRCLVDPPCRTAWENALLDVSLVVSAPDFPDALASVPAVIQPYVDLEGGPSASDALDQCYGFLAGRKDDFERSYDCVRDYAAHDLDQDGHACRDDCNEGDPDSYVGAQDTCGDGIDQDCNGRADDAPECPDCTEMQISPGTYLLCTRSRTYAEAQAICAAEGAHVWFADSTPEQAAVLDVVRARGWPDIWLGLSDQVDEGVFVWDDGRLVEDGYVQWSAGEPNDYDSNEDCVQVYLRADESNWNDIPCDNTMPTVCELP